VTRVDATDGSRHDDRSAHPAFEELDRPRPLPQRVADEVLKRILAEGLQPGEQLPSERELAAQFGVSRTVIREGMRSLAGKGIVDVSPGRGIRVARVGLSAVQESIGLFLHSRPTSDYRQLHEVRTTLEVDVAGLAAERRNDEGLELLQAELAAMEDVIDDPDAASVEDLQFHRELARCTDNELFLVTLDALVSPLLQIRRYSFGPGGRAHDALAEHRVIFERVRERDGAGARQAMRDHLRLIEADWERLGLSALEG
jgi:GntR family transcriptional repressor for pyruvate dehydrogenase complex